MGLQSRELQATTCQYKPTLSPGQAPSSPERGSFTLHQMTWDRLSSVGHHGGSVVHPVWPLALLTLGVLLIAVDAFVR